MDYPAMQPASFIFNLFNFQKKLDNLKIVAYI